MLACKTLIPLVQNPLRTHGLQLLNEGLTQQNPNVLGQNQDLKIWGIKTKFRFANKKSFALKHRTKNYAAVLTRSLQLLKGLNL